jgi:hypothetical protein
MQVIHLGQKELAERWRMSEATLERWRSDRIGPVFLKIRGRVLYRHVDRTRSIWKGRRMRCAATAMPSMKRCCSTCPRWAGSTST